MGAAPLPSRSRARTACATITAVKPKVIVDCDPGHDDAVALLVAARHADLLGVTTVSGNVPLPLTTANALLVTELAGIDVEVHEGADRPLVVEPAHASHVHGKTGLDGSPRPEATRRPSGRDAVEFIVETVRAVDDVWLVPIGPLTNIARALRAAPDIAERVAGISLMGGGDAVGNVTAVAEFNAWADPHAAAEVFASGVARLMMLGLNLTHQFTVDAAVLERLRDGDGAGPRTVGTFVAGLFEFYLAANKSENGLDFAALHDPCAVLAVTHPTLFAFQSRHVAVAVDDELTRGMTVVDHRPLRSQPPNCEVATHIDRDTAMEIVIAAVCSFE
ncbi:MAG TPA: hypothetical protein DEP69_01975 [Acidimicrobiaceae bacterium]|nr:hypothetical protein [Acidimicrobiaceae bacterium]